MNREDAYLLGCLYAIHKLQERGSIEFAVKMDGNLIRVPWDDICKWIEDQYGIEKGDVE